VPIEWVAHSFCLNARGSRVRGDPHHDVELPPEENVASNLCCQHFGLEVAAEYVESSTVGQHAFLPLLGSYPSRTTSVHDHDFCGHTMGFSKEAVTLVR
jgi:hypothetical protein